jgi:hypothetical protein
MRGFSHGKKEQTETMDILEITVWYFSLDFFI